MSDLKSKIPDLNEITSMAGKLFKDVKKSIVEIIADYKEKHPQESADKPAVDSEKAEEESVTTEKVADKKEDLKEKDSQKEGSASKPEELPPQEDK